MKKLFSILVLGAVACGGSADDGVAVVKGRATAEPGVAADEEMDAFLMWFSTQVEDMEDAASDEAVEYAVTSRSPIGASFPADYDFALAEPPVARALLVAGAWDPRLGVTTTDEVNIGFANIAVAPASWLDAIDASGGFVAKLTEDVPDAMVGSEEYAVVYVDGDVKENTLSAYLLGGALKKGYHLVRVIEDAGVAGGDPSAAACAQEIFDACIASDGGTDSEESRPEWSRGFEQCRYDAARESGCFAGAVTHKWRFEPVEDGAEEAVSLRIVAPASSDDFEFPLST